MSFHQRQNCIEKRDKGSLKENSGWTYANHWEDVTAGRKNQPDLVMTEMQVKRISRKRTAVH